ncbi:MAG: hypothetical protein HOH43_05740 [Candidatus Latescibacteria bacterium]|nr:hypothetical protein [Candidatus Latescibacterota bacterium]
MGIRNSESVLFSPQKVRSTTRNGNEIHTLIRAFEHRDDRIFRPLMGAFNAAGSKLGRSGWTEDSE